MNDGSPSPSKTFDRRFCWLNDREAQEQFEAVWEAGIHNLAAEHHLSPHHKTVRPVCPHEGDSSQTSLQGCNKIFEWMKARPPAAVLRACRWLLATARSCGHDPRSTLWSFSMSTTDLALSPGLSHFIGLTALGCLLRLVN